MAGEEPAGPDPGMKGLDDLIMTRLDAAEGGDDPKPVATDDDDTTPEADDEITSEEDLDEDEEGDIEEEEAGEEELEEYAEEDEEDEDEEDEEGAEEDEDEEEEDEEVEDVLSSVTADDLQRINEDPVLNRLYKSMQRDYTTKTKAVSERQNDLDTREKAITDFEGVLRTAQGLADYLAQTMERRPDVVGAAFEAVATGERQADFLIAVGVEHPEVFETAFDRVQEILGDSDEKKRYERERDMQVRDASLKEREDKIRRATFDRELTGLERIAEKRARSLGLGDDDLEDVRRRLHGRVKGQVRKDGSIVIGPKDAKAAADEVHAEVKRIEERILKRTTKKQVKQSRAKTKEMARKAKAPKRSAPRSAGRKTPSQNKRFKAEQGRDPLDSFIDHRLSE